MTRPLSVVLTSFGSPWLREAIASVIAQGLVDWELLVLDDANLSRTRDLVYESDDPRIRYLANPRPLGPALNHQRGIDEACHDLVAFLNHDDIWEPTFLEWLIPPFTRSTDVVVSFADHWVIHEDGTVDELATEQFSTNYGRAELHEGTHRPFDTLAVVHKAIPIAQAAVMRKEALPRLPRWVGGAYDFYVSSRLAATDKEAVYVPKRLARFREHSTNLGLQRSPRRDLARAGIYALAARSFGGLTRRHALRQAVQSLSLVPRSAVRSLQSKATQ